MKLILILLATVSLYGDIKSEMLALYEDQKYKDVCNIGFENLENFKRDDNFVSLYAFACLKSDFIDRLVAPVALLKFSKESRANSAYFSVILMQKKLLYHALVDGYNLSSFTLPTTDYILSRVFDMYAKLQKHEPREFYLFDNPDDAKIKYKLFLMHDKKIVKMVIEELYNGVVVKRHIYW